MIYILSIALLWAVLGAYNGAFYAKGNIAKSKWPVNRFAENLHRLQNFVQSLFLAVLSAGFFTIIQIRNADLHVVWCLIISFLMGHGTMRIFNFIWQGFINLGCGLPFINKHEEGRWEFILWGHGVWLPKISRGRWRLVNALFWLAYVWYNYENLIS